MQHAIIHLNGSGKKALLQQYRDVLEAAQALQDKLKEAAPHGRDYYPLGPDAYNNARREFEAQLKAVERLVKDYTTLAVNLMEGP